MSDGNASGSRVLRIVRDNPIDPVASILSSVFLTACILEIPDRLDLTASELGIVIGCVGTIAASLRTLWSGRKVV